MLRAVKRQTYKSIKRLLAAKIEQLLDAFVGLPNTEETRAAMKDRLSERSFTREQVTLAPGEEAPDQIYIIPPNDGHRWETDDEFRKRISYELNNP